MAKRIVSLLFILGLVLMLQRCAAASEPGCYTKTVEVCPAKRPPHKKLPPKVVVVPGPLVIYRDREVVKLVPGPIVRVPVVVRVPAPYPVYRCPGCGPEPKLVVGGWAAIGLGVQDPYVSGNIGLQLRVPKAHLGLRAYSALQYGFGLQLLIYPYQGERVKLHIIDPGVMIPVAGYYLSDKDINRSVDLVLGAGVEIKLTCLLALTLDLRTSIPDPGALASHSTCGAGCRNRIDGAAAVGNAFAATQLLVGLLVHN
jgi:hypothetical protein